MLHDKADRITAFAATKTFVDLLAGRHGKGGCFLIVKRAEAQVIGTPSFQFYKTSDHIEDIGAAHDLLYGIGRNHEGGASY
jgi:hypothetical protein